MKATSCGSKFSIRASIARIISHSWPLTQLVCKQRRPELDRRVLAANSRETGFWETGNPGNPTFRDDLVATGAGRQEADADRRDTVEKEQPSFWDCFELSRAASLFDGGFVADDFISF
jgi:hypothetical protein